MNDTLQQLYQVILERRSNPQEGSYTCYLFDKGLDKILKKVGPMEWTPEADAALQDLKVGPIKWLASH